MRKIKVQDRKLQNILNKCFVLVLFLFFMGCEGFRLTGSMCDSLQPGEVSTECRAYNDEEATKASEHDVDESGECLKCKKAEKIEIRQ